MDDALAEQEKLPLICEPGEGIYYDPNWKDCVADDLPPADVICQRMPVEEIALRAGGVGDKESLCDNPR